MNGEATSLLPTETILEQNTHPIEYFDAQVQFAQQWSHITGEDLCQVLLQKTAIFRRIWDEKAPADPTIEWSTLLQGVDANTPSEEVTRLLYTTYASQPHGAYTPPAHAGAFGYDYLADKDEVKIHFTNPVRGEDPFTEDNMPKRRNEFKDMLVDVLANHPEAKLLMSASWIRSTRSYRSLSPTDIAEQRSLMSADMSFGGDSVWGQFVDRNGKVNLRVYNQFIESVQAANSIDDLLAAFPYKVMMAEDPIERYYDYYGLTTAS